MCEYNINKTSGTMDKYNSPYLGWPSSKLTRSVGSSAKTGTRREKAYASEVSCHPVVGFGVGDETVLTLERLDQPWFALRSCCAQWELCMNFLKEMKVHWMTHCHNLKVSHQFNEAERTVSIITNKHT